VKRNPFAHHLRLKVPCPNCPFRVVGAIELHPGRLDGIKADLLGDDHTTFDCHKTTYHADNWVEDDDGADQYQRSGREAFCAGAVAWLLKRGQPTVGMRVAFALRLADPSDWDAVKPLVIE
jgi:hypothetical protein